VFYKYTIPFLSSKSDVWNIVIAIFSILPLFGSMILSLFVSEVKQWIKKNWLSYIYPKTIFISLLVFLASTAVIAIAIPNNTVNSNPYHISVQPPITPPGTLSSSKSTYESNELHEVIVIPAIFFIIDKNNVSGGAIKSPDDIDSIVWSNLIDFKGKEYLLINEIKSITSTISDDCEYKYLLLAFTNDPKPGERNGGALELADNITSFIVENPQNLTNAALTKYRYIALALSIYSFACADNFTNSPLMIKSLNRVCENYEHLANIENITLEESYLFYNLAASLLYRRIYMSYDDEVDGKRISNISSCRILYIRIMDDVGRWNREKGLIIAYRADNLTKIALDENLIFPGDINMRIRETKRIDDFIKDVLNNQN
jgi:hypothetical protein